MDRNVTSAELASGLVEQAERLVKLEIDLAKTEVKELAVSNGIAAGLFAGAGLLAILALLVVLPLVIVLLVPLHWLAAVVWLVIYLILAAVLALVGRSKLQLTPPRKTVESLKETKDWALQQMRSPGR